MTWHTETRHAPGATLQELAKTYTGIVRLIEGDISDFLIAIAEIEVHIFNDNGVCRCGHSEQGKEYGGECAFHQANRNGFSNAAITFVPEEMITFAGTV